MTACLLFNAGSHHQKSDFLSVITFHCSHPYHLDPPLPIRNWRGDSNAALQVGLVDAKTDFRTQHRRAQVADSRFASFYGLCEFADFALGTAPGCHGLNFNRIISTVLSVFFAHIEGLAIALDTDNAPFTDQFRLKTYSCRSRV